MNKEEIFNILNDKETWDTYRKFKEIEDSIDSNELYKYIDEFIAMLDSNLLHVRLRVFRILCKLSKYDINNKIDNNIDKLLELLNSDKPTIVRQCLGYLNILIIYKPNLKNKIKNKVKYIDYLKYKDTMSPLIKNDIENILKNC